MKKKKIGRPANVESPEQMYELWEAFKKQAEIEAEKWLKVQYVGKEGQRMEDGQKIPLTFEGFKRYCHDKKIGTVEQYFTNQDNDYTIFLGICSRIKDEIRENQIIGGMLGFFNPSITQRLNGLTDKQEIKTDQPSEIKVTIVKGNRKK